MSSSQDQDRCCCGGRYVSRRPENPNSLEDCGRYLNQLEVEACDECGQIRQPCRICDQKQVDFVAGNICISCSLEYVMGINYFRINDSEMQQLLRWNTRRHRHEEE